MSEQQEPRQENTAFLPTAGEAQERSTKGRRWEPSQYETAMLIAGQLGERDEIRCQYIVYLVRALGRTQARRLLKETLDTREQGDETFPDDESRCRTPSEVFFHLTQTRGKPKRGNVLSPFGSTPVSLTEKQPGLPGHKDVAQKIAERLLETGEPQRQQIESIVWALGQVQAWAIMLDAIELNEGEGILTPNGSRRRTVGGIFFYLVYTKGIPEPGKHLRCSAPLKRQPKTEPDQTPQQPQASPPFVWEDRLALVKSIRERGTATTVKITLVGTLGTYEDRGTCIIGVMQSGEKVPALPRGVPAPRAITTNYVVYIGARQWKNVAATVADPEDALIIEGYPQIDAPTDAISVFVTNVTSKKLQAAKRQGQA